MQLALDFDGPLPPISEVRGLVRILRGRVSEHFPGHVLMNTETTCWVESSWVPAGEVAAKVEGLLAQGLDIREEA